MTAFPLPGGGGDITNAFGDNFGWNAVMNFLRGESGPPLRETRVVARGGDGASSPLMTMHEALENSVKKYEESELLADEDDWSLLDVVVPGSKPPTEEVLKSKKHQTKLMLLLSGWQLGLVHKSGLVFISFYCEHYDGTAQDNWKVDFLTSPTTEQGEDGDAMGDVSLYAELSRKIEFHVNKDSMKSFASENVADRGYDMIQKLLDLGFNFIV